MGVFKDLSRSRCKTIRSLGWLLLILFLAAVPSFSQATGTILGTVKDASGGMVPQAKVTIVNTDTNDTRTATTGDDGAFRFPALATGHYSVRVEKEGFSTQTQTGLTLEVTQELVLNPSLQVGTSTQEVTVTGETPVVNTTNSSLGGLVNEDKIADLPLNGRNYVDLALMQTGINLSTNQGATNSQGGTRGQFFSADGASTRSNMFTLDSTIVTNSRGGSTASESGTTLGVEGVKEFKVATGAFSAEYGTNMGGQVVMVSKGGTNQFHGNLFEYLRNSSLDARNFFDYGYLLPGQPRVPHYVRNNFGVSVSGPIKKDKTFFNAAYEGFRQVLGQTLLDDVPPAACHNIGPDPAKPGFYHFVDSPAVTTPIAIPAMTAAQNTTACGTGLSTATVIPGTMPALLGLFPSPNLSGNRFTFPFASPSSVNYGQIRVDHNFSEADTLFGRFTSDKAYLQTAGATLTPSGTGYPSFSGSFASRNNILTIGETHIFSPNMLNTVHIAWARTRWDEANVRTGGDAAFTGSQYSFNPGQPVGSIAITGFSSFSPGGNSPQNDIQSLYQVNDDAFYTKGKHALKFGTQMVRWLNNYILSPTLIGSASFSSMSNFLTGVSTTLPNGSTCICTVPTTFAALANATTATFKRNVLWYTYGFYIGDDWRLTPRLTLNLGLRYEFATQWNETSGNQYGMINILTDTATTKGPEVAPPTKDNFSPRVGFAWDVTGNGKTSLRGGFGRYYDVGNIGGMLVAATQGQPPLTQNVRSSPGDAFTLPLTFTAAELAKTTFLMNDYHMKTPNILKYTLTIDRQLPLGLGLSVSYVGTRGLHEYRIRDGNPSRPAAVINGYPYYNGTELKYNPALGGTTTWTTSDGTSRYNALQLSVIGRQAHGLTAQFSYTYSHDVNTTSAQNGTSDCGGATGMGYTTVPWNDTFNRGPACFDLRHNAHFNMLYYVPNIKSDNLVAKVLRGWWLSNVVSASSGYAFTPVSGTNRTLNGNAGSQVDYLNLASAADAAACPALSSTCKVVPVPFDPNTVITGSPLQWYNPNMFVLTPITTTAGGTTVCTNATCKNSTNKALPPGFSTVGNAPRGLLRGPGLFDWDVSVNKDTALPFLGEAGRLQFRVEMFNILNHANFGMPNGSVFSGTTTDFGSYSEAPSATAGRISNTIATSRQIQLALKVMF